MRGSKDLPWSFPYSDFTRENKDRLLSLKNLDLLAHKLEYLKQSVNGKNRIKIKKNGCKAIFPCLMCPRGFLSTRFCFIQNSGFCVAANSTWCLLTDGIFFFPMTSETCLCVWPLVFWQDVDLQVLRETFCFSLLLCHSFISGSFCREQIWFLPLQLTPHPREEKLLLQPRNSTSILLHPYERNTWTLIKSK